MNPVSRAGLMLGLCVLVAITVLSVTHALTRDRIDASRQQILQNNLQALLPEGPFDNDPVQSQHWISAQELGTDQPVAVFPVYRDHKPFAAVLSVVAPDGYNGNIHLLAGFTTDGTLLGVRVTEHHETPGLGDAMEVRRSPWITQFDGLTLGTTRWAVQAEGGQFDAMTGATITSRAVINAAYRALRWYRDFPEQVFSAS